VSEARRVGVLGLARSGRAAALLALAAGDRVFASDAGEALLAAAVAGMGLAFLPNWMVNAALGAGELVPLLPDCGSRPVPIQAVYPSARQVPAKVRLFVDHLARTLVGR